MKNDKKTVTIPVETVEKMVDFCISTLEFWKANKSWPVNLVNDTLIEIRDIVSRSHIND